MRPGRPERAFPRSGRPAPGLELGRPCLRRRLRVRPAPADRGPGAACPTVRPRAADAGGGRGPGRRPGEPAGERSHRRGAAGPRRAGAGGERPSAGDPAPGEALVDRDGALDAGLPADRSCLQRLLARALPDAWGTAPAGGSMTVRRPSGHARLALHVMPVGDATADFGGHRVAALVLAVDPGAACAHRRAPGGGGARPDAVREPDGGAAVRGPRRCARALDHAP